MSSTPFGSAPFGTDGLGSAPFYLTSTIIDAILRVTGHKTPASETTKRLVILDFLQLRYQEITQTHHYRWLQGQVDFRTVAPITDGTVNVELNSAEVAGIGTAWDANSNNYNLFWINGANVFYHVKEILSPTALTLTTKYSEEDTLSTGYSIGQNRYRLPKECGDIKLFQVDGQYLCRPCGVNDFRAIQRRNPMTIGRPEVFCFMEMAPEDGQSYIEVFPTPDDTYQASIDYNLRILKLADSESSFPVIPDKYRSILFLGGLSDFHYYMKNVTEGKLKSDEYKSMLNALRADRQISDQDLVFVPARRYRRRSRYGSRFGRSYTIEDFGKLDCE